MVQLVQEYDWILYLLLLILLFSFVIYFVLYEPFTFRLPSFENPFKAALNSAVASGEKKHTKTQKAPHRSIPLFSSLKKKGWHCYAVYATPFERMLFSRSYFLAIVYKKNTSSIALIRGDELCW